MDSNDKKVNLLATKFVILLNKQEALNKEISSLKNEIDNLKNISSDVKEKPSPQEKYNPIETKTYKSIEGFPKQKTDNLTIEPAKVKRQKFILKKPTIKSDIEKFIGENLINKIGIIVIIIGVSIGAKYAIDNNLISPTIRIILGYLVGLGLFIFALKLKENYKQFSAALYSGAMAIIYFITYAAFSYYSLFPSAVAYSIMVITTVLTVFGALKYDKQVIAHIGLVGSYSIPFLLSKEAREFDILYIYVAIINIGILFISFKKSWKLIYYTAFILTWSIVLLGYFSSVNSEIETASNLVFATVFFTIFYAIILAYKSINKELFKAEDVFLILLNSFIFYGIGYSIILNQYQSEAYLGLFTLTNAIFHLGVCSIIYFKNLVDKNLYYLVLGLAITYITIAIPVELNGNWVTLLWGAESVLLFWIGRTKKVNFYEYFSYPLIILTFLSLAKDWNNLFVDVNNFNNQVNIDPIFNIYFLTGLFSSVFFGIITYLSRKTTISTSISNNKYLYQIVTYGIPIIFIITLYATFRNEIAAYWEQLYNNSKTSIEDPNGYESKIFNYDLIKFESIYLFIYTFLFIGFLSIFNITKIKNKKLGVIMFLLSKVTIFFFLISGLYTLGELRESYLSTNLNSEYSVGIFHLLIRYISFGFLAGLLVINFKSMKQLSVIQNLKLYFELFLTITILWALSSELIHWMDIGNSSESYKLGLSIFWGIYSLILIALGIWKNLKHLRILAFVVFGFTLIKLFFYDITHLDTISKTIVFVSLGILLLIISFLYNKYQKKINS
jgi:uncharacterized membrane protein